MGIFMLIKHTYKHTDITNSTARLVSQPAVKTRACNVQVELQQGPALVTVLTACIFDKSYIKTHSKYQDGFMAEMVEQYAFCLRNNF